MIAVILMMGCDVGDCLGFRVVARNLGMRCGYMRPPSSHPLDASPFCCAKGGGMRGMVLLNYDCGDFWLAAISFGMTWG